MSVNLREKQTLILFLSICHFAGKKSKNICIPWKCTWISELQFTEEIFCLELQGESHPLFFCCFYDTKIHFLRNRVSQNQWDQKEHLEVILSNPILQAGTPKASQAGQCPNCFWISPRLHNLSNNLWQCLVMLTVKNSLLIFRGNLLCFSVCPLTLVLSLMTMAKNLAVPSLHPPFSYLIYAYILLHAPSWAFFPPDWTAPALSSFCLSQAEMFLSPHHLPGSSQESLQ